MPPDLTASIETLHRRIDGLRSLAGEGDGDTLAFPLRDWDHQNVHHSKERLRDLAGGVLASCLREEPRTCLRVQTALSLPEHSEGSSLVRFRTRERSRSAKLPLAQVFGRNERLRGELGRLKAHGVRTLGDLTDWSSSELRQIGVDPLVIDELDAILAAVGLEIGPGKGDRRATGPIGYRKRA